MIASIIGSGTTEVEAFPAQCRAKILGPEERADLAVNVLARTRHVTTLADENDVSRKFLYEQARIGSETLHEAFASRCEPKDTSVLFHLPITKEWVRQAVLGLMLTCHSSARGAVEFLSDIVGLGDRMGNSVGTVHNILHEASKKAAEINAREDLSGIHVGAHDEIFQSGKPVLVGADVVSQYCYLLALEEHRDADTWGVHLLDLKEQGLHPKHTIADAAKGLRAGQNEAWPGIPCWGDTFHALQEAGGLGFYLQNRAKGTTTTREKLESQMARVKRRGKGNKLSKRLALARIAETKAIDLAEDVQILVTWLREDILAVVGPDLPTRRVLFDFVVEELKKRESLAPHRIEPVRRALENQRDELLAFAEAQDVCIRDIAKDFHIAPERVRALYELEGLADDDASKWQREAQLRREMGSIFRPVQASVREVVRGTVRASSIIENINSRLRNYFFLRRNLSQEYLDLLRFFLNHHRFVRSEHPDHEGKSPAEILTGRSQAHWLEQLGFERFQRAS